MRKGTKALSLLYLTKGEELMHLRNTWHKPFYEYEKNNFNYNSMNAKKKLEALWIMFFANEFTTDITSTLRIYRFYVYYD